MPALDLCLAPLVRGIPDPILPPLSPSPNPTVVMGIPVVSPRAAGTHSRLALCGGEAPALVVEGMLVEGEHWCPRQFRWHLAFHTLLWPLPRQVSCPSSRRRVPAACAVVAWCDRDRSARRDKALELLDEMVDAGYVPLGETYDHLMRMCRGTFVSGARRACTRPCVGRERRPARCVAVLPGLDTSVLPSATCWDARSLHERAQGIDEAGRSIHGLRYRPLMACAGGRCGRWCRVMGVGRPVVGARSRFGFAGKDHGTTALVAAGGGGGVPGWSEEPYDFALTRLFATTHASREVGEVLP